MTAWTSDELNKLLVDSRFSAGCATITNGRYETRIYYVAITGSEE